MDWSHFTAVRVDERDDRVVATLHRPHVRNAIDQRMVDELHELCAYLELNRRVLILAGYSNDSDGGVPVFASGADIAELRDRRRDEGLRGINAYLFHRIARLPMPVIAAVDGYALGGGAELAFAADFRIGTPRMRLGNPETSLGIMAAAGATWRLKELVGEPLAKEILLAGRVLNGEECLSVRLITELVEPAELLHAAHRLADRIGHQDPTAVQITKTVFRMPPAAHPEVDALAQALLFESDAKFERMDAFLAKKRVKKAAKASPAAP
nr:enoyl-CoA hydratase/isomerase family protein [Actinomycetales bacterium]